MPLDWERILGEVWPPLFDTVGPALVGLTWTEVRLCGHGEVATVDNSDLSLHQIMGAIVSIRGDWAVLTAAHAIRPAMQDHVRGRRAFKFHLQVGLSGDDHSAKNVPFGFDRDDVLIYEDDDSGEDLAFVLLKPDTHRLLAEAGAECVPDSMFASASESFDAYAVPGIVDELTQVETSGEPGHTNTTLRFTVPMLPVEPMDDYPNEYRDRKMFLAGRVVTLHGILPNGKSHRIDSLAGMSGSPVFGLRINDGGLVIRLVGVQSEFIREESIIGASCPHTRMTQLVCRSVISRAGHTV